MKKGIVLLTGLLLAGINFCFSQGRNPSTYEPGRRAQSIYMELLGPGISYSFNYDSRFQQSLNGLGGRVGISYYAADGNSMITIPIMVNYLLGKEGKYFEMGIGGTYAGFNSKESAEDNEILFVDGSGVVGTMVFGYRKQPVDGGFLFRAGISPMFGKGNFIPYYGYIGFGYSF